MDVYTSSVYLIALPADYYKKPTRVESNLKNWVS